MFEPLIDFPELKHTHFSKDFIFTINVEDNKNIKETLIKNIPLYLSNSDVNDNNQLDITTSINKKFEIFSGELGLYLISFINKIDYLLKELHKLAYKISISSENKKDNANELLVITLLYDFKHNLSNEFEIISNTIDSIIYYLDRTIPKYGSALYEQISIYKDIEPPINSNGIKQWDIEKMKQQLKETRSIKFYKELALSFISDLINNLLKIKDLIDNSFISSNSNTKIYSGAKLILPPSIITYTDSNLHPIPSEYTYIFHEITDFVNICLFHISIEKKVLARCKNCTSYFIPNKNNELYCNNLFVNNKTCKDIGAAKAFYNRQAQYRPYDKLYKIIYDRLKNNLKYKEEFELFKEEYNSIYAKSGKDENIINTNIHKFLTNFDRNFQKKHPIKKGRGYSSSKFWYTE